jgi:hypothetical protein
VSERDYHHYYQMKQKLRYEKLLQSMPDPIEARAWAKKKVDELVKKAMEGMK